MRMLMLIERTEWLEPSTMVPAYNLKLYRGRTLMGQRTLVTEDVCFDWAVYFQKHYESIRKVRHIQGGPTWLSGL